MLRVFALGMALGYFVSPAAADPFDFSRTIAFGDSLSDNGNLAHNIPPDALPPFLPGYFNGRFSNGPTWIELLSDPAKSTNPDSTMNRFWGGFLFGPPFDVGGNVNNVNAAIGGADAVGGTVPSVQTQIGAFLAAGGVFGPNDLVSIQGGANDFFGFFGANPAPTVADISSFATTTGLNEASNLALATSAGAKTILVSNLPNLGATPSFNGSALSAQAGLFAAATYNATLDQCDRATRRAQSRRELCADGLVLRAERGHRQSGGVRLHQCDRALLYRRLDLRQPGRIPVLGRRSPDRSRP